MTALLRATTLFITGSPVSKWLTFVGLALLSISSFTLKVFAPLGLACVVVVPLIFGGLYLRIFAAPTRFQLTPRYRITLLLAGLCTLMLMGGVIALFKYVLFNFGSPPPGTAEADYAQIFATTLAIGTALWFTLFWASKSPATMQILAIGAFPTLVLLPLLAKTLGYEPKQLFVFFKQTDHLFWSCVAAWSVFAIGFLRAKAITTPDFSNSQPLFNLANAQRAQCEKQPIAMLLNPQAEVQRRFQQYALSVVMLAMLFSVTKSGAGVLGGAIGTWVMVPAMMGAIVLRRAKFLWLRTGSRDQAFQQGERVVWRHNLPLQISMLILLLVVSALPNTYLTTEGLSPERALITGIAILVTGSCWLYYGLSLTQWNARNIGLGILTLAATLPPLIIFLKSQSFALPIALLLLAFALAIALRMLAKHRWRNLDWRITNTGNPKATFRWIPN